MSFPVYLNVDGTMRLCFPVTMMACDALVGDLVKDPTGLWQVTGVRVDGRVVWIADRLGREHLYNVRTLLHVLRPGAGIDA